MDSLLAARLQMAFSLGFHIIFAVVGMVMPFLMAVAHTRWLRTGDHEFNTIRIAWMKGTAILFATGAVSGTVLSFELGLLWPEFMKHAGPIFGMPFSWEGTAFFLEAIALGLYLYGEKLLKPKIHCAMAYLVGTTGVLSGIFVVCANAWMNAPTGFLWIDGQAHNIDPVAAMFNPAWISQTTHMTLAAFIAVGFGVAGIHALLLLRGHSRTLNTKAIVIALWFGSVAALIMPLSGDFAAKDVADRQPEKLAAMEAHFHTEERAGLLIGGIPNEETMSVSWGFTIPGMLSFLAHGDIDAEVTGLDAFPRELWPPVAIVHYAFQIMVGIGSLLALIGLVFIGSHFFKKDILGRPLFQKLLVVLIPSGIIALEAGWVVTEVGRQPWIIYRIMKTADAVTPMPGIAVSLVLYLTVYLFLGALVTFLLWRQFSVFGTSEHSLSATAGEAR